MRAGCRVVAMIGMASLLAWACARPPVSILQPRYQDIKSYRLGEPITAATGTVMISSQEGMVVPAFRSVRSIQPEGLSSAPPGLTWVAWHRFEGECGDVEYVITSPDYYGGTIGFAVDAEGELACEAATVRVARGDPSRSKTTWSVAPDETAAFRPIAGAPLVSGGLIRWELLYAGRAGDTLHLTFREFVDDPVRPSFDQALHYDLAKSNRIVFRALELEISDASNAGIAFTVIRD